MRTLSTRPSCKSTLAVMAMSLMMQKPEPQSGKAWWVPPAVLQASLYRSASLAVSSVPAHHINVATFTRTHAMQAMSLVKAKAQPFPEVASAWICRPEYFAMRTDTLLHALCRCLSSYMPLVSDPYMPEYKKQRAVSKYVQLEYRAAMAVKASCESDVAFE